MPSEPPPSALRPVPPSSAVTPLLPSLSRVSCHFASSDPVDQGIASRKDIRDSGIDPTRLQPSCAERGQGSKVSSSSIRSRSGNASAATILILVPQQSGTLSRLATTQHRRQADWHGLDHVVHKAESGSLVPNWFGQGQSSLGPARRRLSEPGFPTKAALAGAVALRFASRLARGSVWRC